MRAPERVLGMVELDMELKGMGEGVWVNRRVEPRQNFDSKRDYIYVSQQK